MRDPRTAPPAIGIGDEGSFPWSVFHERHPALARRLGESLPYGPGQRAALRALVEESRFGNVGVPGEDDADRESWLAWAEPYLGRPWREVPFLWAESYFYRRLLGAVGFLTPGAWYGVDPFAPLKTAELHDPDLAPSLAWLDDLPAEPARAAFDAVLLAALHGNRADLTFRFGRGDDRQVELHNRLLADDTADVWSYLRDNAPQRVTIVLDNAGRELLADLVLADHLLTRHLTRRVDLHVKPTPYYVSDAVTADVRDCLNTLAAMPGAAGQVGHRLRRAAADGLLRVGTHWFYCAPFDFFHMPADLAGKWVASGLTLVKGDLNYRRLVGDRAWDHTLPFTTATQQLPGRIVALRTLKSEVVVGLDQDTVRDLEATDPTWRVNGTRALVQARL